jgi:Ras-related protein Rab-24
MSDAAALKVIVIGATGVGKTSLINAHFGRGLSDIHQQTMVAIVSSIEVIIPVGRKVVLNVWDTAGQERFQNMNKAYYQGAQIALVCYDQGQIDTIPVWVGRAREFVPDCVVFLVATKKDLWASDPNAQTRIKETSEHYKKELGVADVYFTSARNDAGSIELLFEAAAAVIDIIAPTPTVNTMTLSETPRRRVEKETVRSCHC